MKKEMYFLAIETSCDDTSISILKASETSGRLQKIEAVSNYVSSQTELHKGYGGVYPFLAKREHQKNLPVVFEQAVNGFDISKLEFISVTKGPGLDPCLWTGINFAQDLAKNLNKPLVGANHLEAHFLANLLTLGIGEDQFKNDYLPAVCLVVSGGHTILFLANGIGDYQLLGQTQDDAAGECFDKTARILNLGYPGGPAIAQCAQYYKLRRVPVSAESAETGTLRSFDVNLPRPMLNQKNYNFSFSGLKTAVLYDTKKRAPEILKSQEYLEEMSYQIQQSIIDVLVAKTVRAAQEFAVKSIIIGGGVASNSELRRQMQLSAQTLNIKFLAPAPEFSTDNAAMSGAAAYFAFKRGQALKNPQDIQSQSNLSI